MLQFGNTEPRSSTPPGVTCVFRRSNSSSFVNCRKCTSPASVMFRQSQSLRLLRFLSPVRFSKPASVIRRLLSIASFSSRSNDFRCTRPESVIPCGLWMYSTRKSRKLHAWASSASPDSASV